EGLEEEMEKIRQLEEEAEELARQIMEGLHEKDAELTQGLREALREATQEASDLQQGMTTWSTEPGSPTRLPAQKRLELARRMKDRKKLKEIADLVGPMKSLAF